MTIGELQAMLSHMDPREECAYTLITHAELHILGLAAGVHANCREVNRALQVLQVAYRHRYSQDQELPVDCLRSVHTTGELEEEEKREDEVCAEQAKLH